MRQLFSTAICVALLLAFVPSSHAFMDFFQKDLDNAPGDAELARQEGLAQEMVNRASGIESSNPDKARNIYRDVVKKYPLTTSAALSQYKVGHLYRVDGKQLKAFDAYQTFVENYKHSSAFAAAIKAQYEITRSGHDGSFKDKFIGIPRKLQPSELLEMYGKIIKNAPFSEFAPLSQFAIGEVYQEDKKDVAAIAAYQKMVNDYPRSSKAPEAQARIGEIGEKALEKGSEDTAKVEKARAAYNDLLIQFPNHALARNAEEGIARLKAGNVKKTFEIAKFYEKQGKGHSARIYYAQVAQSGDPEFAAQAQEKLATLPTGPPPSDDFMDDAMAMEDDSRKKGFRLPKLPRFPGFRKKEDDSASDLFPDSGSPEGRDLIDNEIDGVDWAAMDRDLQRNIGADVPPEPKPIGDETEQEERKLFGIPKLAFWKKESPDQGGAPAPDPEDVSDEKKGLKKLAFWKKDDPEERPVADTPPEAATPRTISRLPEPSAPGPSAEEDRGPLKKLAFWKKNESEPAPEQPAERKSGRRKLAFWKKEDSPPADDFGSPTSAPIVSEASAPATSPPTEEKKKKKLLRMPKLPTFKKKKEPESSPAIAANNPIPPGRTKPRKLKNQPRYVGPPAPRKATSGVPMRTGSVPFTTPAPPEEVEVTATIPEDPRKLVVPPPPEE